MARMLSWRKTKDDYTWRSRPTPEVFKLDCKLEIVGGITYSKLVNRHTKLIIEVKDKEGKYVPSYSFDIVSSWMAKEFVDSLLFILKQKECITSDEALQWFINELQSFKKLEPINIIDNAYTSELGYRI